MELLETVDEALQKRPSTSARLANPLIVKVSYLATFNTVGGSAGAASGDRGADLLVLWARAELGPVDDTKHPACFNDALPAEAQDDVNTTKMATPCLIVRLFLR